jgi:hypothetical protein
MKADTVESNAPPIGVALVDIVGLLKTLFPDPEARPSVRATLKLRDSGAFPFIRWGRRIYYDPEQVRWALNRKCTVKAR